RLMVLDAIAVAHLDTGAAVGIHGRRWDVGVRVVIGLTVVGLEAADDVEAAARALRDEIAELISGPQRSVWICVVNRAAGAFPPRHDQRRSAGRGAHEIIAGRALGVVGGLAGILAGYAFVVGTGIHE